MPLPLAAIATGLGALGQAAGGPAVSGGPASFGGVSVGSKVVGSGTAATVPPPQNAAEASVYAGMAGSPTASIINSPNLPIIALAAGLLVAVLFLFRRNK